MPRMHGLSDKHGGKLHISVNAIEGTVRIEGDVTYDEQDLVVLIDALNEIRYYTFHFDPPSVKAQQP